MMTRATMMMMAAAGMAAGIAFAQPASAGPVGNDSFNVNTRTPADAAQSPVKWFESFDDLMAVHKPTAADRVILSRPFNQEAERVQEWIETATKVSKSYRDLARKLRALEVPVTVQGARELKELTAEWYDDAASIYEELIRPRRAARTMEELEDRIKQIEQRAQSLSQTNANLKAMDLGLRRTYKVHLARHEDRLQQYVRSK